MDLNGSAAMTALPKEACFLAFDYGEKRIGVAVGNTITGNAQALTIIANQSREIRFKAIQKLIETWQPHTLIVGRPCHPDGTAHAMTQQACRFGRQLAAHFHLPVVEVDERYSSVAAEAEPSLQGLGTDAQAAYFILQQFLDERRA